MLVTSQSPVQNTKFTIISFQRALVPPHWKRFRTHHCWSSTPQLNGCDFPPSTRTQFSEEEYSYLTASKRHPSTPDSHNTHKTFHEKPGHILSQGRLNICIRLWHVLHATICPPRTFRKSSKLFGQNATINV